MTRKDHQAKKPGEKLVTMPPPDAGGNHGPVTPAFARAGASSFSLRQCWPSGSRSTSRTRSFREVWIGFIDRVNASHRTVGRVGRRRTIG